MPQEPGPGPVTRGVQQAKVPHWTRMQRVHQAKEIL
jgi:hypothetical protein